MVVLTLLGYIIISVALMLVAPRTTLAVIASVWAYKVGLVTAIFGMKLGFFVFIVGSVLATLAMILGTLLAIKLDIRCFKPSFDYLFRK